MNYPNYTIGKDYFTPLYVQSHGLILQDLSKARPRCKLFAYGSLRPGFNPPISMEAPEEDYVEGNIIGVSTCDHPVIHIQSGSDHWIPGVTMTILESELNKLDEYEGPEYERIKINSYNGHDVWVYVGRRVDMRFGARTLYKSGRY